MYITDLQSEFYNILKAKRVLLLVNYDIDGICACKILQHLFYVDHIVYTLVPVQGIKELHRAFTENSEDVKYVILINCGGTIDLIEVLQPPEEVVFFVADNHRPTDVCNIYSNGQIRLLSKPEDSEEVPNFDDIFRDDESEGDEEEEDVSHDFSDEDNEDESPAQKRQRTAEERILRRREKRIWEESRNRILFKYSQFSYFGRSTAVLMFELSWKLSKDNNDLLWWAVVGLTEQLVLGKLEHQQYVLEAGSLQTHVSRLSHHGEAGDTPASGVRITFDKDLLLLLYRHWTLWDSLRHSPALATRLRLWTIRGEKELCGILVDVGLPLVQCRQQFSSMDLELRQEVKSSLEKQLEKANLVDDLVYAAFTLQHGFRHKFCALDCALAALALLEAPEVTPVKCFMNALDCLSRSKVSLLQQGIEKAKRQLTSTVQQVHSALSLHLMCNTGPFVILVLQEGFPDWQLFAKPHCLQQLARFALRAYAYSSRSQRARRTPMLVSAPFDPIKGTSLIAAVPPVSEESSRNFFGKAFEQAAEKINAEVEIDYLDTSVIQVRTEDRTKFIDALASLLN